MTDASTVDQEETMDEQTTPEETATDAVSAADETATPDATADTEAMQPVADAADGSETTETPDAAATDATVATPDEQPSSEAPPAAPRRTSRSRRQPQPEEASVAAASGATADVGTAVDTEPAHEADARAVRPAPAQNNNDGLRGRYHDEVVPALQKEFGYVNPMQVPRVYKVVVNIGLGEALQNAKALDAAVGDLTAITGQKPIVTRARRSIAQFRLRTGNPIGAKVTLRGQHMWDFLERLTRLALPRIRDFRGVPTKSFDGRGNYSLGLREQLAFPEIDYDKIDRLRGLEVSIVTTAKTDEESKRLLELLGMPFAG